MAFKNKIFIINLHNHHNYDLICCTWKLPNSLALTEEEAKVTELVLRSCVVILKAFPFHTCK
jgi:hypothetical protein